MGGLFTRLNTRDSTRSTPRNEADSSPGEPTVEPPAVDLRPYESLFTPQALLTDLASVALSLAREPAITYDSFAAAFETHVIYPRIPPQAWIIERVEILVESQEIHGGPEPVARRSVANQSRAYHTLDRDMRDPSCSICLMGFGEDSSVNVLACRHIFHVGCLDEWLKRAQNCPLCRSTIE